MTIHVYDDGVYERTSSRFACLIELMNVLVQTLEPCVCRLLLLKV